MALSKVRQEHATTDDLIHPGEGGAQGAIQASGLERVLKLLWEMPSSSQKWSSFVSHQTMAWTGWSWHPPGGCTWTQPHKHAKKPSTTKKKKPKKPHYPKSNLEALNWRQALGQLSTYHFSQQAILSICSASILCLQIQHLGRRHFSSPVTTDRIITIHIYSCVL